MHDGLNSTRPDEPDPAVEEVLAPTTPSAVGSAARDLRRWVQGRSGEWWMTLTIVAGCAIFVFLEMHPQLVFRDSLPTGGDMGAHVWGPAYLRDELLPNFRLSGWTPDWYAGFPAFQFYMVVPALAIVYLNAGLTSSVWLSLLLVAVIAAGAVAAGRTPFFARHRGLLIGLAVGLALFLVSFPYGVAFKLIAVLGLVSMPISAWALGHMARLPFPGPAMLAVATLPFLFDRSFNIYGGNAASTMAGEFAFSISLSLALLFAAVMYRGFDTGRHRVAGAALLALVTLCHLIPVIFVAILILASALVRLSRRVMVWLLTVGPVAVLLSLFWTGPFFFRRELLNDMGWEKLEGKDKLVSALITRETLNPDTLRDNPPLELIFGLAVLGFVVSIARRSRLGVALGITASVLALLIVDPLADTWSANPITAWHDLTAIWNARYLPFYYFTLYLLAGIGIGIIIRWVGDSMRDAFTTSDGELAMTTGGSLLVALGMGFPLGGLAVLVNKNAGPLFGDDASLFNIRPLLPAIFAAVWIGLAVLLVGRAIQLHGLRLDRRGLRGSRWFTFGALATVSSIVFISVAAPLGALPGGTWQNDGKFHWGPFASPDRSFVSGWAEWNFTGYQARQGNDNGGGWDEYIAVVDTMAEIGEATDGCGRAFWEFAPELNRYGTTMAMMLLPFWTESCIGSMEGLYFESSATVPYHFLMQSELSGPSETIDIDDETTKKLGGPSQPQRGLPYTGFSFDAGVEHMQLMGVRYYMAFSTQALEAARSHADLTEIASSGPWAAFEVAGTQLVEPLALQPAVLEGVGHEQEQWLDVGIDFFQNRDDDSVFLAADGPDDWLRIEADQAVDGVDLPEIAVTDIETTNDTISFSVDQVGVPVLVKTSYFPNWKVDGAEGPYRVTPNLMVVIPTETEVELRFGRTNLEYVSYAATVAGLLLLALFLRRTVPAGVVAWDPLDRAFRGRFVEPPMPVGPAPFTWATPVPVGLADPEASTPVVDDPYADPDDRDGPDDEGPDDPAAAEWPDPPAP